MFGHLKQLWMGIWSHIHTVTTTDVSPDLRELAEILDDVSVKPDLGEFAEILDAVSVWESLLKS